MISFKIIYVTQTKQTIYEDLIHYFQWLVVFNTVTTLGQEDYHYLLQEPKQQDWLNNTIGKT